MFGNPSEDNSGPSVPSTSYQGACDELMNGHTRLFHSSSLESLGLAGHAVVNIMQSRGL